jgi:hypothetical protein
LTQLNDVQAVRRAMLLAAQRLVTDDAAGVGVTCEALAELLRDLGQVGERHQPGTLAQLRQAMLEALADPTDQVPA